MKIIKGKSTRSLINRQIEKPELKGKLKALFITSLIWNKDGPKWDYIFTNKLETPNI